MFRKKKEKPLSVEAFVMVCEKTIYTQKYTYMMQEIKTFEDRLELSFIRIGFEPMKRENLSAVVPLSDERLIPFQLGEETLYWDTADRVVRLKVLPEGEPEALIPPVLFYPNDVMTMERAFAEENFSEVALSYATLKDDRYIWYYPDGSAAPAVFEAPRLFSVFIPEEGAIKSHPLSGHPIDVMNQIRVFADSYVVANNITEENYLAKYRENLKKGKTEEEQ